MTFRACLLGAGRMGQDHAKHIHCSPYATLHCVVDPIRAAAEQLAVKYAAKAYTSAEEALADPQVDAVVIASQTDTHADLIILAAKAGKPIFCEKPIDMDLERIDRCLEMVEATGMPLLIGFNRRFDPSFQHFRQELINGTVGPIELLAITSRDHALPKREFLKNSGGLFRDMMIHDFDMTRWLLREEPIRVFAAGSCMVDPSLKEIGDVDTAVVTLETASGAIATVNCSRRAAFGYDQRLEVLGPKGMLNAHNLKISTVEFSGASGCTSDKPHPSFPQRYREAYQIEMDHFFRDVCSGKQAPLVSGADGRQAIVIANAAQQSFDCGAPVAIECLQGELCCR